MALAILQKLIQYPTVTPLEHNIYDYIHTLLPNFEVLRTEKEGVKNIFYYYVPHGYSRERAFKELSHFCFAGHIDVVPPGGGAYVPNNMNEKGCQKGEWEYPPFEAVIKDGYLYGRGTQDMKGGIACFLSALQDFLRKQKPNCILSVLLTSDEEGPGIYGSKYMLEILKDKKMLPHYAIVAEPTSLHQVGDMIKIGRRGSINGVIMIEGKQGHVAYPEKCVNPVELLGDRLGKLAGYCLDKGDGVFSESKIVITDIRGGLEAVNVTPNDLKIMFNVRNSPLTTLEDVRAYIDSVLDGLPYKLTLNQSSKSFLTHNSLVTTLLQESIVAITSLQAKQSTSGGTSDARFFSEYGVEVVEIGVCNDRIHAINERVAIKDIELLKDIFLNFLMRINKYYVV